MGNTKIYKALADFQQEVPVMLKNADGYGYKYLPLPDLIQAIKPLLKKHKLGFTQICEGEGLTTTLFHVESEETLTGTMTIPQDIKLGSQNPYQVLGSGITYLRRYSLESMLGIVSSKDTDGNGALAGSTTKAKVEKVGNAYIYGSEKFENTLKVYKQNIEHSIESVMAQVKKRHNPDVATLNKLKEELNKIKNEQEKTKGNTKSVKQTRK